MTCGARAARGVVIAALAGLIAAACTTAGRQREAESRTGGEVARGRQALRDYGCAACHTIPGVAGADGLVGPPLSRMGARVYVAGAMPNTPSNLMRWIQEPRAVSPGTAMPDTGVTDDDARHIAAYLYTLH